MPIKIVVDHEKKEVKTMAAGPIVMEGRSRSHLLRLVRPRRTDSVVVATRSWAALVAVALGGVLLVAFLYAVRGILAQLLAAAVLAISLEPLVHALERRRFARPAAVTLTFVVFLLATAAFVYALLPPAARSHGGQAAPNGPRARCRGIRELRVRAPEHRYELPFRLGPIPGIRRTTVRSLQISAPARGRSLGIL